MSDDKPMTALDRIEADLALLAAVARKDALLPGQQLALQRLHDYLSARLADAEQPAVAGDGGLREALAFYAENWHAPTNILGRALAPNAQYPTRALIADAGSLARAALSTSVPAVVVNDGIEKAYRYVRALYDAHTREFGVYDPSTNVWEFDGPSEEIDGLYKELVEGILALKDPTR